MSCSISDNVRRIRASIECAASQVGRNPNAITLIAASKMVSPEKVQEAHSAGIHIFGENRLQEAQQKQQALSDIKDLSWHFIGRIQRRKIKDLVGNFDLIHSVESMPQAREMQKCAEAQGIQQAILLEINVSGEETKGGFLMSEVMDTLPELDAMTAISVRGLMTIPPKSEDPEGARPYFRQLKELAIRVEEAKCSTIQMTELSMGMSHDYHVAVEEGATMVRVGTSLFGARNL